MALIVRLETTAPGQGLFRLGGISVPDGRLELAVQRNRDDRYLTEGQVWQVTPHWHSLRGVESEDGDLSVHVGPRIIDPLSAASNMALRVLVRVDGLETSGVLRIKGHLLGSPAAREPGGRETAPAPDPDLEPDLDLDLELIGELREPPPEPAAHGHRLRGLMVGLSLLVLIVAGGIAAWQLGWLDRWLAPKSSQTSPEAPIESIPDRVSAETADSSDTADTAAEEPPAAPTTEPSTTSPETPPVEDAPAPEPRRGIELAAAFLATNPRPAEIQAEAERQEQALDCDAAMVLYNRAAQAEPRLASTLARRLDPQEFVSRGCIAAPDATAASLWYREAADAGDPVAQRRLGQLLIAREGSGALFEEGIRLLRLAAQAGDQEAKDLLVKLGKR